jgi:hypothetical protein
MPGCLLCQLVLIGCLAVQAEPVGPEQSYLCQPSYCLDKELRGPIRPYCPQPGDIMLATDHSFFWAVCHNLAFTGHPHHSGIIIALPDGRLAALESGPHDTLHIELLEVLPNLQAYENEGPVWIRRRAVPLTPEQSAGLTNFALCNIGKRFSIRRILAQASPFRARGPLRTWFLGGPHFNRNTYYCSELVLEACVAGGLLDPATTRPSATYPRDLFYDRSPNLFLRRHFSLAPCWEPPARWLSSACSNGDGTIGKPKHFFPPFNRRSQIEYMCIDPASLGCPGENQNPSASVSQSQENQPPADTSLEKIQH